jgi:hypothetical protein
MKTARCWSVTLILPFLLFPALLLSGCGKPTLDAISIEPASAVLTVGQTLQLRATGLDKKGKPLAELPITWAVEGENGRIDNQGLFTALKPGTVTVAATSGAVRRTATLTIEREKVAKFATTVTPPEVTVGQQATLTVIAQNAQGQGLADVQVQARPTSQGTTVAPQTATTAANGQATFSITVARQVAANQVRLSADGQQTTVTVQGVAGPPATLRVTTAATEVTAGQEVRVQVAVQDEAGNPVSGQQVRLTALSAGTTLAPAQALTTDERGEASVAVGTGTKAGANRIRLEVAAVPPQEVEVRGSAGAPARVTLQAESPDTVAGGIVAVTVQVHDAHGNAVANAPIQLTATPAAATLEATTLTTDANGTAGVRLRTSPEAAANAIEAVVANLSPAQLTVTGQAPTVLRITPQTATVDMLGTQRFQAVVADASGHTAEVTPTWKVIGETGTVAADGTFTAAKIGSDVVMATYAGLTAGAQLTVVPGAIARLQVTPAETSLVSGTTQQLQVKAFNAHGYPLEITPTWNVTNQVGTIDTSGLFTATKAGSGEIVATAGDATSRARVTVTAGELATLVTTPERVVVQAGEEVQLQASGRDSAGNAVPIEPTWRLDTNLGALDAAGVFRAQYAGKGAIRVEAGTLPVVAEIPVEVTPAALHRIEVQPQALTLSAGVDFTFTAKGYDAFGNTIKVTPVWELLADLGTLDATGTFAARRSGAALVRTTVDQLTAQASVVVKPGKLTALAIEPAGPLTMAAGDSVSLMLRGRDAYGNTVAVSPIWSQSELRGTLSPDGTFRAEKVGTVEVMAQSDDQHAAVRITITPGKLATMAVTPAVSTIQAGATLTLQATGLDAYANPVQVQPTWRVEESIGEVDANGLFTAMQARTGQVVATAEGVSGRAQVTVQPGPLALLKVTPESLSLTAGETAEIVVVGYDAFGNPTPAQPVWQVTEGMGTVTAEGRLTAQKAGEGRVVAAVGHLAAVVSLRVQPGAVDTLRLHPPATRLASGRQEQFTVQGFDQGGNLVPVAAVAWEVQGNIGTIDANGVFTASLAQTGRVVARAGALQAIAEVHVEPGEVTSLRVMPTSATVTAGERLELQSEAFDAAGNRVPTLPTWWVTEDLGTVSSAGIFQAQRAGAGRIVAAIGAVQQAVHIHVQAGPPATVVLSPAHLAVTAGDKAEYTAKGYDAYGNAVPIKPVWSLHGQLGRIDPASGSFHATTAGTGTVVAVVGTVAGLAPVTVKPGATAQVQLDPPVVTMVAGNQTAFSATALDAYNNITPVDVAWSLIEPQGDLANGTFQARRAGPTAVTASVGTARAQAIVHVQPGPVVRLHVTPERLELASGTSQQFRAYGYDAYDNAREVSVTWELSEDIGQLAATGVFTAGKQGTGRVIARLDGLTAQAQVTVVPGPVQRVVLTPGETSLASTMSLDFSATGLDAGGNPRPVTARWALTQGIGTLEPTGRFTAQRLGYGTVVAYTDALVGTAEVQVTPGPVALLFVTPPQTTVRAGETVQFQVQGFDTHRNPISALTPRWSVAGDPGTIDPETGVFTATTIGWGKVQATVGGERGSADVVVQPAMPDADHSRLVASRVTLPADGKTPTDIVVLVRDRFGNPVPNAQVTLISSRDDTIAQPGASNQQGVAVGRIRSSTPGQSDITAVAESVRISNSLRLTFSQPGSVAKKTE